MDLLRAFVNLIGLSYVVGVLVVIIGPVGFFFAGPLMAVTGFAFLIPLAGAWGVIPFVVIQSPFSAYWAFGPGEAPIHSVVNILLYLLDVVLQILLAAFLLMNLHNPRSIALRLVQIHSLVVGVFLTGFWAYLFVQAGSSPDFLSLLPVLYLGVFGLMINVAAALAIGRWRRRLFSVGKGNVELA